MFQIPIVPVGTKPQRTPRHVEPSEPKQTLYLRNLNEQIDLEQMKLAIQSLFNPLDVKIKKNVRVRGQAFVSFSSVELAKRAMSFNGYLLFDKPIDIQWARHDSDNITKNNGTFDSVKAARSSILFNDRNTEAAFAETKEKTHPGRSFASQFFTVCSEHAS